MGVRMNSYINPLAFRDRYAQDYYKVDRWPGWAVHAEQEILDIKGSLEPEVRKYVQVQDVLERLAGSGRLGVPNLQEVSVREGALAVFDSIVLPAWAVTLRVPHVVICGPELKNPDLQVARKMPAGWYGVTTSNLTLAVPELGMWAAGVGRLDGKALRAQPGYQMLPRGGHGCGRGAGGGQAVPRWVLYGRHEGPGCGGGGACGVAG